MAWPELKKGFALAGLCAGADCEERIDWLGSEKIQEVLVIRMFSGQRDFKRFELEAKS
jgi:hypothetical protein